MLKRKFSTGDEIESKKRKHDNFCFLDVDTIRNVGSVDLQVSANSCITCFVRLTTPGQASGIISMTVLKNARSAGRSREAMKMTKLTERRDA